VTTSAELWKRFNSHAPVNERARITGAYRYNCLRVLTEDAIAALEAVEAKPQQLAYLNGYQIKALLDFVDSEDDAELCIQWFRECPPDDDGLAMPEGLWTYFAEYPEEGRIYLPETAEALTPPQEKSGGKESGRAEDDISDVSDFDFPCGY